MQTALESADSRRRDAEFKEMAHKISAEHHRKWGVRFGLAAAVSSAIAGTGVAMAAAKSTVGQDGQLTIPAGTINLVLFGAVVVLSIVTAVLNACQQFLKHEEESARHLAAARHFTASKRDMELFILASSPGMDKRLDELQKLEQKMDDPPQTPPSLTPKAEEVARKRLASVTGLAVEHVRDCKA